MTKTAILGRLNKQLIQGFEDLHARIEQSQGIIITAHFSPDGDNIGSCVALYEYIHSLNKNVVIFNEDPVPDYLQFLDSENVVQSPKDYKGDFSLFDTAIVLDSGDLDRIGFVQEYIQGKYLINIDHHKSNTSFAELDILDLEACATAEIIYSFLLYSDIDITEKMAYNLFTAIATDTGFFRFQSMHQEVYLIAADLMSRGVDPSYINQKIYQSREPGFLKLLGRSLDSIEWYSDNKIAIATLTLQDFQDAGTLDTEGIVNQIGIVDSVEVFILVREKEPGLISASLRSKNYVDVSDALSPLGGGGHARAAGCRTRDMDMQQFKNAIIHEVQKQIR